MYNGVLRSSPQLLSKHCPRKCVDAEVTGVDSALIKAVQVFASQKQYYSLSVVYSLHPSAQRPVLKEMFTMYRAKQDEPLFSMWASTNIHYKKHRQWILFVDKLLFKEGMVCVKHLNCLTHCRHQHLQGTQTENTHWFHFRSWRRDLTLPGVLGVAIQETLM